MAETASAVECSPRDARLGSNTRDIRILLPLSSLALDQLLFRLADFL